MLRNRLVRRNPVKSKFVPQFKNFDVESVPKEKRMAFLQNVVYAGAWVPKSNLIRLRAYFERHKARIFPLSGSICYVCDKKAEHRHHIVPLSRGGQNVKKNLVPLCNQCHTIIHPWMAQKA